MRFIVDALARIKNYTHNWMLKKSVQYQKIVSLVDSVDVLSLRFNCSRTGWTFCGIALFCETSLWMSEKLVGYLIGTRVGTGAVVECMGRIGCDSYEINGMNGTVRISNVKSGEEVVVSAKGSFLGRIFSRQLHVDCGAGLFIDIDFPRVVLTSSDISGSYARLRASDGTCVRAMLGREVFCQKEFFNVQTLCEHLSLGMLMVVIMYARMHRWSRVAPFE